MVTRMFEVGVVAHFEAAHRLSGDFGTATRLHGHTYRVEAIISGEELSAAGVLFDVGRLQQALATETARLNYRDLAEIPELAKVNTTAETVARFIHDGLAAGLVLSHDFQLAVRVWESPHVFAGYSANVRSDATE
jgi:6-pyruvoyltetrahydropterin/6-carboxytetrahydropterin synthase